MIVKGFNCTKNPLPAHLRAAMIIMIYKSGMTGFKAKVGLVDSLKRLVNKKGTLEEVIQEFVDQSSSTYRDQEILKLLKQC